MMRSERYDGEQYRSITLPREVDETKVEAGYQGGLPNKRHVRPSSLLPLW